MFDKNVPNVTLNMFLIKNFLTFIPLSADDIVIHNLKVLLSQGRIVKDKKPSYSRFMVGTKIDNHDGF